MLPFDMSQVGLKDHKEISNFQVTLDPIFTILQRICPRIGLNYIAIP
jgi:hypothetical protein